MIIFCAAAHWLEYIYFPGDTPVRLIRFINGNEFTRSACALRIPLGKKDEFHVNYTSGMLF